MKKQKHQNHEHKKSKTAQRRYNLRELKRILATQQKLKLIAQGISGWKKLVLVPVYAICISCIDNYWGLFLSGFRHMNLYSGLIHHIHFFYYIFKYGIWLRSIYCFLLIIRSNYKECRCSSNSICSRFICVKLYSLLIFPRI